MAAKATGPEKMKLSGQGASSLKKPATPSEMVRRFQNPGEGEVFGAASERDEALLSAGAGLAAPAVEASAGPEDPEEVPQQSQPVPLVLKHAREEEALEPQHSEERQAKRAKIGGGRQRGPAAWGPFWSYSDCVEQQQEGTVGGEEQLSEQQQHQVPEDVVYPEGVVQDAGKWAHWLPEGWGQGVKRTAGGNTLRVYVQPGGKVFYHKRDIQASLQTKLPERTGRVSRHDEVDLQTSRPSWPKQGWLPKDWFVCYKKLPNRLMKCFISPDKQGYAYHKFSVLDYLSGKSKLTPVSGNIIREDDDDDGVSTKLEDVAARTLDFNAEEWS